MAKYKKIEKRLEKHKYLLYNLVNEIKLQEVFMFENIVTKKELKFKDLEEEFFKLACSMVNEMFKVVLEKYDEEVMNTRDSGVKIDFVSKYLT